MSTPELGDLTSRHFKGRVLRPSDEEYEARRAVYNGFFGKRPALIAVCRGTSDVASAVRHARENDLELSVRCGGKHPAGFAATDGGLMIDLSEMTAVHVDPVEQTAWVQGGA